MTNLWSKLTSLGIIVFAVTFFLPLESPHSPSAYFRWSYDAVFMSESPGETLAFLGICLALAYPYIWALITALFFFGGFWGRWSVRMQFICQLLGGISIVSLGLTLILLKAEFPPGSVQWIAVLAPVVLLLLLLMIVILIKPPRRFPALSAVTLIIFAPLQFVLYYYVCLDGGVGWGYLMGGLGALVGLVGSSVLIFSTPINRGGAEKIRVCKHGTDIAE